MNLWEIIIMSISLSIDSFAVSLSGSVGAGRFKFKKLASVSLILALVQTAFLLGGYFAGDAISVFVQKYGPWIGFAMLLYVGIDMIVEAVRNKNEGHRDLDSLARIFIAAVATSIDALAVGASLGLSGVPGPEMWTLCIATFIATVAFAVAGMLSGAAAGRAFGRPAKIAAGVLLIVIGIQILMPSL